MRRDSPVDCRPTGIIINCIYSSIHCIIPCRFRVNRNNNNRNRRTLVGGPPRLPHSPSVLHGLQRQLGESEGEDVTLLIHLNCKTSPPSIFHTFNENPLFLSSGVLLQAEHRQKEEQEQSSSINPGDVKTASCFIGRT